MKTDTEEEISSLRIVGTWIETVFNKAPIGIMQFDPDWKLVYANTKALEICGFAKMESKNLEELFPDAKTIQLVRDQMDKRSQGISDEYKVEMIHGSSTKLVSVSVAGMPVMGSDGKIFAGSIAILRSLELEQATEQINQRIDTALSSGNVLRDVAHKLQDFISFDGFIATAFSEDMTHSSILVQFPHNFLQNVRRWNPVSPTTQKWSHDKQPSFLDAKIARLLFTRVQNSQPTLFRQ